MSIVNKVARSGLSAACLIVATTSALAANDPTVAAPGATAAAQSVTVAPATVKPKPEDKVICKTETPIGSRLGGHKVCMTRADWAGQSERDSDLLRFRPPTGASAPH